MPTCTIPVNGDAFYAESVGSAQVITEDLTALRKELDLIRNRKARSRELAAEISEARSSNSPTVVISSLANAIGIATFTELGGQSSHSRKAIFLYHPDPTHSAYPNVPGASGQPGGNQLLAINELTTIRKHGGSIVNTGLAGTPRDQFMDVANVGTDEMISVCASAAELTIEDILDNRNSFYKQDFVTAIGNQILENDMKTVKGFTQAVIAFERIYETVTQARHGDSAEPKYAAERYPTFKQHMITKKINTRFSRYGESASDLKKEIDHGFRPYCRKLLAIQADMTRDSVVDNGNEKDSATLVHAVHRPSPSVRQQRMPKRGETCGDCGSDAHLKGFAGDQQRPACKDYDPKFAANQKQRAADRTTGRSRGRDRDRDRDQDRSRGRGRDSRDSRGRDGRGHYDRGHYDRDQRRDNTRDRGRRSRSPLAKRPRTVRPCHHGLECKQALNGCKFDHGPMDAFLAHHSKSKK
jgi:hypothetical protein